MYWRKISEIPKHKNRNILFVQWHDNNKFSIIEYLASSYQDALNFRSFEMKNSFTHWIYVNAPKN